MSQLGPAAELTAVLALPFLLFFPLLLPQPEEEQESPSFTCCSLHKPAQAIPPPDIFEKLFSAPSESVGAGFKSSSPVDYNSCVRR